MARLCPIFSGSKGNCHYIGSSKRGILIDVGRSAKQTEKALTENGLDIKNIEAIFITHEHSDHIKGVRVLASKYNIPVYSSAGTLLALEENGTINGKFPYEVIDKSGISVADMFITPFHTSHDCNEGYGYKINTYDERTFAIATDLGYISSEVKTALTGCDTIVIESNHDIGMLENGSYPYILKKRIMSKIGHLSNTDCSSLLPYLTEKGTTRFVLAHLSQENNIPELAYQTAVCNLTMSGMKENSDYRISVAPAENIKGSIIF